MSKRDVFKFLIKEFHEKKLPLVFKRELSVPSTSKKVITLCGSRRSGKTFYFYQLIGALKETVPQERIVYIDFEDDRLLPLGIEDMNELVEAYYELYPQHKEAELFFFLDEIQNILSWEAFVRRLQDTGRIRLFVTGSSSKLLSREIATSLRGRTLTYTLFPLSFRELLQFKGINLKDDVAFTKQRFDVKNLLEDYIDHGGFPEVVLDFGPLQQKTLREYFDVMMYKDVTERFSVRNGQLLKALARYLLTNIGNRFSGNTYYHSIHEQFPVSKDTVLEYLSYLEEANIVFQCHLFSYSMQQQQKNPRKVYCIDNGLRNVVSFRFSEDTGRLVENLVFLELIRREVEPFYWKGKQEVDFVYSQKEGLVALNVCSSDTIPEREVQGLLAFKLAFPKTQKLLLLTKDLAKEEQGISFVPLWKWLLGL